MDLADRGGSKHTRILWRAGRRLYCQVGWSMTGAKENSSSGRVGICFGIEDRYLQTCLLLVGIDETELLGAYQSGLTNKINTT